MRQRILDLWNNQPLKLILLTGIVLRLIAAVFSKGYGMHDDHFLVLEPAQSWVDGYDYNSWLPGSNAEPTPSGHSFFYVGIHYIILLFLQFSGITDPQVKMFIIRLLHAGFSLITIYVGYKITLKLADQKTAKLTGLLLATLWFMPFLSVRNLVEVVSIPFLVYGSWLIINYWDEERRLKYFLYAGLVVGLGFSIRFQIITFAFGLGLAILLKLRWKEAFIYGIGFFLSAIIIQGGIDLFVWGKPFMELTEYVRYNMENATEYITNAWYTYLLLILGSLIPPVSIFLFAGFIRSWRKHLILFLPAFIFLVFHSLFPNKQERFIFPIIPFVVILGMVGWQDFLNRGKSMIPGKGLLKTSWIIFWVLNIILLLPVTTMYTKRSRVESMCRMAQYEKVEKIMIENTVSNKIPMIPTFYAGQRIFDYHVDTEHPIETYPEHVKNVSEYQPRFFFFLEPDNLEARVAAVKNFYPKMVYETTIEPSLIDKLLYRHNHHNANQTIVIYRNTDFFP